MSIKERYLSQLTNVIKSLNEQYYMSHDEYFGIAKSLLNGIQMRSHSDDYIFGFSDALSKIGEFFKDKA